MRENRSKICLIGDLHGEYRHYLELTKGSEYSVQLGDFGFDYHVLHSVNAMRHKVLGGNHDNYQQIRAYPHYLGDFGSCALNGVEFFFIRGAFSIDWEWRTPNVSWWADEELNSKQQAACLEAYLKAKPRIVLSHDCPNSIYPFMIQDKVMPNRTADLLEKCFMLHQPDTWVFAHHHKDEEIVMETKATKKQTSFHALGEHSTIFIDKYGRRR